MKPLLQGILFFALLIQCGIPGVSEPETKTEINDSSFTSLSVFADAFSKRRSDFQVRQEGVITRILPDDTVGDRHQRMIIRLGNNQTLLIAHNIDLAFRVPNPATGKKLRFCGEYAWNDEGGVVHWTHKDPAGVHDDGYLEYQGKRYA